jgi:tetratricopeptide (TPR) repeat protein
LPQGAAIVSLRKCVETGLLSLAILLLAATSSKPLASAVDDGNAGLEALNSGDLDNAIKLFTRAINSGTMSPEDKEFAYLNRGKAYLAKRDYKLAKKDLRLALKLNPADGDVQTALDEVERASTAHLDHRAEIGAEHSWGLLGTLADRCFWHPMNGKKPHYAVLCYKWAEPQKVLDYTVSTKSDVIESGEYKIDSSTGAIVEAVALATVTLYATAADRAQSFVEYTFFQSTPFKSESTLQPDGSIIVGTDKFENGAWVTASTLTYSPVTEEELAAEGFRKKH